MIFYSSLPGVKHFGVVLLLACDAAAVLKLSKLGSTFFVHFLLQVSAHGTISLAHLHEDISLVSLLVKSIIECLVLMSLVHALKLIIDLPLVILLEPLLLISQLPLQHDVSFSIRVNIFHQVNLGLVLAAPLLLSGVPLLSVLIGNQLINHLLVGALIRLLLVVVSLELLDLPTASQSLVSLNLLNLSLVVESLVKKLLIAIQLHLLSMLSQLLLSGIVLDEFQVALTVQQELLMLGSLLLLLLGGPLSFEHGLLTLNEL